MIVCLCHAVTERDLDRVISDGASTVEEIGRRCGAGTDCGACLRELRDKLDANDIDLASLPACAAAPGGCGSALVSVRSRRAD